MGYLLDCKEARFLKELLEYLKTKKKKDISVDYIKRRLNKLTNLYKDKEIR